jgi:hypothetical protein
MVIFLKTSIPIKTASYFGLDADLLSNICALLAFVWAVYLGFEHSDAYENLKQAEGKSLLDASDEYDDKYQYPLRLRPRWWFLDFFD